MADKIVPNKSKNESANETARNSENRGKFIESTRPGNKGNRQNIDTTGSTGPKNPTKKK